LWFEQKLNSQEFEFEEDILALDIGELKNVALHLKKNIITVLVIAVAN
jgi:hypothetical protein